MESDEEGGGGACAAEVAESHEEEGGAGEPAIDFPSRPRDDVAGDHRRRRDAWSRGDRAPSRHRRRHRRRLQPSRKEGATRRPPPRLHHRPTNTSESANATVRVRVTVTTSTTVTRIESESEDQTFDRVVAESASEALERQGQLGREGSGEVQLV